MMLWRRSCLDSVNPSEVHIAVKACEGRESQGYKCWMVRENPHLALSRGANKKKLKEWEEINLKI